jgi:hypothetical protein
VLPIVLDGPKETLISGAQYSRMGPALHLRSAADHMAWATLSFEVILSIALICPNASLRELPNESSGPSAMR